MINTCGLRLLLVGAEPGSGGSDPQTPRRVYPLPTDRVIFALQILHDLTSITDKGLDLS
jgi:hypothetical protein